MSNIQDIITDELQYMVEEYESMNTSMIDQMTKLSDYCSKLNRSISKASTQCGCISITANKQNYETSHGTSMSPRPLDKNCIGDLCPDCKELIEKHMGSTLYYMAALCNTLELNLYDVILKELDKVDLLRKYNIE